MRTSNPPRLEHIVVIGGSMAGLLAARVASEHATAVTLLERDPFGHAPEARKGQPQVRHLHGLLASGFEVMATWFPDLPQALVESGAIVHDMAEMMRCYTHGGYRTRFRYGTDGALSSRPHLEWLVRERVANLPNVVLRGGCAVDGLAFDGGDGRVTGVRLVDRGEERDERLAADLVIDASGRGSRAGAWLAGAGYDPAPEETITVGVRYASRLVRRDPDAAGAKDWILVTPDAPRERRAGGAFPIEGDRWIVTLMGIAGDPVPQDDAGFLDSAARLPAPDVREVVEAGEPLSEIRLHRFTTSLRRRYERLDRFPDRLLVLGDAACSFNPLYGQGMTSAALQARALDDLLAERGVRLEGVARTFFRRVATVVDTPWRLAAGEDFRYPETTGRKAPGTDAVNRYVRRVHRATHRDAVVGRAFLDVMNLRRPPSSLLRPAIAARVLARR